ncbi:hypothetical protein MKW98_011325 [Papaver atlanticum]|uniref:AB hydrolase-1 domain-containing protein n=1 Tax=Papaver atlanticum TaxID=357466 RepID=A0AAD4XJC2_9MAGN|nr:hypothetical protein MKW98_011325 [Papaver atlanticum]
MVAVLQTTHSAAMNARIIGSGEDTIIFAHGFGTDQSIWDKTIPFFTKRYRVLLFDWCFSGSIQEPNHLFDPVKHSSFDGFANDLIDLLDEIGLKSSVFVGHSMSGMIGCLASIRRPDLFKRLILLGASPRYINCEDYEGGFEETQIEDIFVNIESNFHGWASYFATVVVDANDPISVDKFEKCLVSSKPEIILSLAKTVFLSDHRDILEKVDQVPCTIIQMTNDIVVPMSVAYHMQKQIKAESTIEVIEADGHFPQLTHTNAFVDTLDRVLEPNDESSDSDQIISLDSEMVNVVA